eukprot:15485317-Alexandrium_andersonii.AAC.1
MQGCVPLVKTGQTIRIARGPHTCLARCNGNCPTVSEGTPQAGIFILRANKAQSASIRNPPCVACSIASGCRSLNCPHM